LVRGLSAIASVRWCPGRRRNCSRDRHGSDFEAVSIVTRFGLIDANGGSLYLMIAKGTWRIHLSYQRPVGSQQFSEIFRYGDSRFVVLADAHSSLGHREPGSAVSLAQSIYNSIGYVTHCGVISKAGLGSREDAGSRESTRRHIPQS